MTERPQHQKALSGHGFLPWKQLGLATDADPTDRAASFEVKYKKPRLLFFIFVFIGLVWMGFFLLNEDTSEILIAVAPVALAPLIARYFKSFFLVALIALMIALVGLAFTELGHILGMIIVIIVFFVFFPSVILNQLFMLIDQRPQLIIDDQGMCCRQYGEDVIPWEHIRNIYVSTYQHYRWLPEQKTLMISLKEPSFYPKSDGAFAPRRWLHQLEALFNKSIGRTDLHIGGLFLDPSLPFVMKAIEHFRPDHKPKRSRKKPA